MAGAAAIILSFVPVVASAQTRGQGVTHPWEVAGGPVCTPGYDLGSQAAELTRNGDTNLGPFDLFASDTSMDSVVGIQGRVGYYLTPQIAIEGGVRYAKPTIGTRLTNDTE